MMKIYCLQAYQMRKQGHIRDSPPGVRREPALPSFIISALSRRSLLGREIVSKHNAGLICLNVTLVPVVASRTGLAVSSSRLSDTSSRQVSDMFYNER